MTDENRTEEYGDVVKHYAKKNAVTSGRAYFDEVEHELKRAMQELETARERFEKRASDATTAEEEQEQKRHAVEMVQAITGIVNRLNQTNMHNDSAVSTAAKIMGAFDAQML